MMGIINLAHEKDFLKELTYFRSGASVPFAGRYRLIDFTLSNMVRSNIQEVAIFARSKYRSLLDHIGSGADWDLDRRYSGLFILPPDWHDPSDISKGDLRYFHNNLDYIMRGKSDYVLISGSQFIANTSYDKLFQHHLDQEADITLLTTTYEESNYLPEYSMKVDTDENGEVTCLSHDLNKSKVFTGVYVLHRDLLLELVQDCIAHYKDNFFMDGIQANLDRLNVHSYHYHGYSALIHSIESYYHHNMKLLNKDYYNELFLSGNPILTKIANQPPTNYQDTARVNKASIGTGCEIAGEVTNSILFPGVKVNKHAEIKNSIIMQRCKIEAGAQIENVILDKDVVITENTVLRGAEEQPYVIAKRSTI